MSRRIRAIPLPHVAALYARVSDPLQDREGKTSLKTQVENGRAWALANGYTVDDEHVYTDRHSGEELYERPELSKLRDAAKAHRFAVVVVNSVERLARDAIHQGIVLEEMDRAGVRVHFLSEQVEDTPDSQIVRIIRAYAGKVENERRVERYKRAITARAHAGKLIPSIRPPYGYSWGPETDKDGKPTKVRLVVNPVTSPVVVRIFQDAAAGKTLRRIALDLNATLTPTPTGKTEGWGAATVRYLLTHPAYWGQHAALRSQNVPVEKSLRDQYAHKSRQIARPQAEHIPLPLDTVPALVSVELAAAVAERLRHNQQHAVRNNRHPERSLLRGGFVRCGYCGHIMGVSTTTARKGSPELRTRYFCHYKQRTERTCEGGPIEAARLDTAVWNEVSRRLQDPTLLVQEVERMRTSERPGADTLAVIDGQMAELEKRIRNKHKYAELVEDDDERADLAAETALLRKQLRALEAERANAAHHYARWERDQEGLEHVLAWCERVGQNLASLTYDERRGVLAALHVDVLVYRAEHTPRAELTVRLPISGAQAASLPALDALHCDDMPLGM